VGLALAEYVGRRTYRAALATQSALRYDLDGEARGAVSTAQAAQTRNWLSKRDAADAIKTPITDAS
jgi:hypothetical protein